MPKKPILCRPERTEEIIMNHRLLISLICLSFLCGAGFAGCDPPPMKNPDRTDPAQNALKQQSANYPDKMSTRVLWTVSGYVRSDGAQLSDDKARRFLFKPLDIGDSWIAFDGRTCSNVSFTRTSVPARDYFKKTFAIEPEALGIADETVEVFTTSCGLPGFNEYVRLRDRRLIVRLDGVFFYFKPAVDF